MKYFIFLLLTIMACYGCKSDSQSTSSSSTKSMTDAQVRSKPKGPPLSQLPNDMLMELWNKCDLIDYIFHDLPFSMNQVEQASIRSNLTYISAEAQPYITPGCKPLGRQIFTIKGEIVLESDIYFSESCAFFIYFIDGKAVFGNKMSDAGMKFYASTIKQGLEAGRKRQNN